MTQRQLETELRRRWAERLISHLAPYADKIPYMQTIEGDNVMEEYIDLLGDTRFRTLRIRCLALESLQKTGFTTIPWSEQNVRDLLNHLRTQEITPHKLQGIWDTLRWFSSTFGLLEVDSLDRLKAKRKTIQESLVETVSKPQRKAKLPTKAVIMALESIAAGMGTLMKQESSPSPGSLLDRYICAVARFQVACSARFNDLQHTTPFEVTEQGKTLELRAWQTKTVSAFRIKKHPVPLIAPLYSFTGVDWWSPLLRAWKRFAEEEAFKTMDYIIPTVSKDYVGLIPRPCQADRALRWLKEALHRQGGLDPREFRDLSWHSFRVFIPDCAFQLGMPRDQRQYLGNWSSESTADIYTREKRKVVERAWTAVADQLDRLNLSTRPDKPVDLQHTEWMDVIRVEEDDGASLESTPKRAKTDSPASKASSDWAKLSMASSDALVDILPNQKSMPARCFRQGTQREEGAALPIDTHRVDMDPPLGPLRVVSASRPVRSSGLYTIHLLTTEGRAIGCGWQPTPSKALDLNPDDYQAEHLKYVQCNRCFKKYTFPTGWGEMRPPEPIHSDDDGASTVSSGSLTDDQDDTASEAEQIPAQSLHLAST